MYPGDPGYFVYDPDRLPLCIKKPQRIPDTEMSLEQENDFGQNNNNNNQNNTELESPRSSSMSTFEPANVNIILSHYSRESCVRLKHYQAILPHGMTVGECAILCLRRDSQQRTQNGPIEHDKEPMDTEDESETVEAEERGESTDDKEFELFINCLCDLLYTYFQTSQVPRTTTFQFFQNAIPWRKITCKNFISHHVKTAVKHFMDHYSLKTKGYTTKLNQLLRELENNLASQTALQTTLATSREI